MQQTTSTTTSTASSAPIFDEATGDGLQFPMGFSMASIKTAIKDIKEIAGAISAASKAGEACDLAISSEDDDPRLNASVGEFLHIGVQMHCKHLEGLAYDLETGVAKVETFLRDLKAKQN